MKTSTTLPSLSLALLVASALACNNGATDPTTASETSSETGTDPQTSSGATTSGDPPTTDPTGLASTSTADPTTGSVTTDPTIGTTGTSTTGTSTTDATTTDATTGTTSPDGTGTTAETTGTTGEPGNTGTTDTTGDPDELGELSGECGLIDAMELESPEPFVFVNALDFGALGFDPDLLTPGGQQIVDEGNLNEGSINSEIVAYEVLARCDMAVLLKTEGTIVYTNPMGKKTDLLIELDGHKVGVSVVRAVGFPKDDPYTVAQAGTILHKKLTDVLASTANVAAEDAWIKQILHVVAYEQMHVDSILAAYDMLDPMVKADTILVVSRTDGNDAFIY